MPATKQSHGSHVPPTWGSDAIRLGHVCSSQYSVNTHSAASAGIASANTTGWYLNPRIR
jgi:hypothetical protein